MISIIIVSYNNQNEIEDCLASIKKRVKGIEYEVLVIDNRSQDGTVGIIKARFPWVKLLEPRKNLGFGRGNNYGAKEARGEYLFFLNPDTIMLNNLPKIIKRFFSCHPKAGVVGIRQLDRKLNDQPENIGVDPKLSNLIFRFIPKKWDYNKMQEVEQVSGAALAVPKKLFQEIGGFDPDFFAYFEDYDLCLRVRKSNHKIFYLPKGRIIHLGGQSFSNNPLKKRIYYQSQDLFYLKHYSPLAGLLMRMIRYPLKVVKTHTFWALF